jgi:hypothetical protein
MLREGPRRRLGAKEGLRRAAPASKKRMDGASNLASVHAVAQQAEAAMLEENSDRLVTREGHEVALHDAVRPVTCPETSPCDESSTQNERRHHCRRAQTKSCGGIRGRQ